MKKDKEEWRPVVGLADGYPYEVSNRGRVRHAIKGNIVRGGISSHGYPIIGLSAPGRKPRTRTVHRLVLDAFSEIPLDGREANHKDGNKLNNDIRNLEWVDGVENRRHAFENGLYPKHPKRKLTDSQAAAIRQSPKSRLELAEEFGVTPSMIRAIKLGLTYKTAS